MPDDPFLETMRAEERKLLKRAAILRKTILEYEIESNGEATEQKAPTKKLRVQRLKKRQLPKPSGLKSVDGKRTLSPLTAGILAALEELEHPSALAVIYEVLKRKGVSMLGDTDSEKRAKLASRLSNLKYQKTHVYRTDKKLWGLEAWRHNENGPSNR